jgi:hypothetical protein
VSPAVLAGAATLAAASETVSVSATDRAYARPVRTAVSLALDVSDGALGRTSALAAESETLVESDAALPLPAEPTAASVTLVVSPAVLARAETLVAASDTVSVADAVLGNAAARASASLTEDESAAVLSKALGAEAATSRTAIAPAIRSSDALV